ncbi:Crp/Fnr family transcriptional regulator [Streptomyces violarus]|uniref:CRP-like cAMP-binding protein n=1 Tax=Streptomyces violarus TaxID=67380 RepID=A0A7W5F4T4_9ACTN|nr:MULTISPECIES: Crp/Fnr family transcriptional regulator [Streptomyces]MBB3080147.1 CRP-like cAMP-binding protein [Streptomyces violarus]WRU00599.1 Crp/Fnr family transcriptional regulator [Streptomyces sp. CGMCC 4.1772]
MPYSSAEWPARSLLGTVPPEARGELLELGVPARFEAGKVLLSEGARDRHVLVLLSGFAKVTARVENGEESLLAVRVGGDSVGEMAAFDGAPRSATVTACGPLTARLVQPGPLHALLVRRPEVHLALTGIIAQRLRWANRRRLDFKGYPAKVRLARLLVELATSYGRPVEGGMVLGCRLTQPELAALTGAAETTVHKGLAELRRDGLLETGYGSTVIRDLGRLREIGDLAPED